MGCGLWGNKKDWKEATRSLNKAGPTGVIVTEKAGQMRYLLGDGLGSIRQVVDGIEGEINDEEQGVI